MLANFHFYQIETQDHKSNLTWKLKKKSNYLWNENKEINREGAKMSIVLRSRKFHLCSTFHLNPGLFFRSKMQFVGFIKNLHKR
jgi:hypothetical protein